MNVLMIGPDNDWVVLPPADHEFYSLQPMNGARGLHLRRLRLV
ncbi:MAG: hypothetical protein ACRDSG_07420 [Pseudonocardiaceae bacterium]